MKKLIYIANARMPTEKAHGIQITKMCEAFAIQGLEVELVLPWKFNKIKKSIFEYYDVKRNFKIKKIFSLDLVPLNIPRICFWIQSLTFSISVFFYLLFKKIDIIYSRDSFTLFLLSFFKKNLICEIHNFPKNFFLHKRVFKKTKAIIVITNGLKDSLIKKCIDENKILVAPDGVDLDKFDIDISKEEARKKLNLPLDKKIVMYIGLFDKWKGHNTLLQASKLFNEETILVMIGGTEEQVKKLKKEYPNVFFLGYLPYIDLPINQKAADVLVIPNSGKTAISKYYTSPLKLFSHMVSQRPIVASNLPSLREILNENNAILVEPDNPQTLVDGIELALKETNFADKILIQAYKDAQSYSWERRVKNILKFINNEKLV
ncbi:MAG: glycosyltransferase [Patescibacteria group bacterium]|nr:glycosyltransferase [Patescibacteria group bacterium]